MNPKKQTHLQGGAGAKLHKEFVDAMQYTRGHAGRTLSERLESYLPTYKARIKNERDYKQRRAMEIKYEEMKNLLETLRK